MKNKFRAWHKKKAAWISDEVALSMDADGNWLWDWIYEDSPPLNNDDIIVQQFTGLVDKNNVEVFEGDRVRVSTNNSVVFCEIEWQQTAFVFKLNEDRNHCFLRRHDTVEVIGNILENS